MEQQIFILTKGTRYLVFTINETDATIVGEARSAKASVEEARAFWAGCRAKGWARNVDAEMKHMEGEADRKGTERDTRAKMSAKARMERAMQGVRGAQ